MATLTLPVLLIMAVLMCSTAGAQEDNIVVVTTGEVLILDCLAKGPSGDLDHEVDWFLDDVQVSNASSLILMDLNHTHHGRNITCYNQTDTVHTWTIHFYHKLILAVGKTLMLNCTSYPTAVTSVTWHQTNRTATTDWDITELDNVTSQLIIPNVTLDETGLYSCKSSGGDIISAFNISVGLYPEPPSSKGCFGCNPYHYTCEWQNIPDTHLPIDVTFEYRDIWNIQDWMHCPKYNGSACYFSHGEHSRFRLNITNALGTISDSFPEYDPQTNHVVPPPRIIGAEALSATQVAIHWTISACENDPRYFHYKLEYRDAHTGNVTKRNYSFNREDKIVMQNANTEYCFRIKARKDGDYGSWSDEVCTRTLPTAPNVKFTEIQDSENEKDTGLRDIELSWKLVEINRSKHFQGVSQFSLEVRLNKATTNEINHSPSGRNFTYDLQGQNDYSLQENTFNYTIPGLSKYKNYTIILLAINQAGSVRTSLKIHARPLIKKAGSVVIAAVVVPLVTLLIVALLAFGFQRLKNNSKPIPEPVYHGHMHNVKPTHIEPEVFDELPAVAKEKERQMLVNLSRESAKSQPEDKGCRTSISTSSGVGSETPSLEMGVVERVPLLQMQDISGSINKTPYSLLSERHPSLSPLQMAPDAMETDLDSMSPIGGHYYSTDEGISVGGSSFYNHLGGYKDSRQTNPYYSMCGQEPGRMLSPSNDSGYWASGSRQSSDVGYDYSLLRANDADDESSLPASPATLMSAYYSSLSTSTDPASREMSPGCCEPYVVTASIPSSPPMRDLATITESLNHYKPHIPSGDPSVSHLPCNSGYVDHAALCVGMGQTDIQDDISNPNSTQSSPEHAIIIHKNPRRNHDSLDEYMDNTYFQSPSSSPLNNGSFPGYVASNTLSLSGANSNLRSPKNSGCPDSPSNSESHSTQAKAHDGYVTCEQVLQVQMHPALADTPGQPLQNPGLIGTGLPTLSGNTGGYVPVAQMRMPAQMDYISTDTVDQTQRPQTGSDSTDLDTKISQPVPAADEEPLVGVYEPDSHSSFQLHESIPTTSLENIPDTHLLNENNEGHEVSNNSLASHVGPGTLGALPSSTNGGYVAKNMSNLTSSAKASQPLELNNNGYVTIP